MAAGERIEVQFERSGGLAGLGVKTTVDVARLPEPEAEELRGLLDRVDFAEPSPPPRGADRFQYDITVSRGGKTDMVTAYDGSMSPGLKALTDWLVAYARSARSR